MEPYAKNSCGGVCSIASLNMCKPLKQARLLSNTDNFLLQVQLCISDLSYINEVHVCTCDNTIVNNYASLSSNLLRGVVMWGGEVLCEEAWYVHAC